MPDRLPPRRPTGRTPQPYRPALPPPPLAVEPLPPGCDLPIALPTSDGGVSVKRPGADCDVARDDALMLPDWHAALEIALASIALASTRAQVADLVAEGIARTRWVRPTPFGADPCEWHQLDELTWRRLVGLARDPAVFVVAVEILVPGGQFVRAWIGVRDRLPWPRPLKFHATAERAMLAVEAALGAMAARS